MDVSVDFRSRRTLRTTAIAVGALAYWRLLFWDPTRTLSALDQWFYLPTDPFPQLIFLVAGALVYRWRTSLRSAMRFEGSLTRAALPLFLGLSLFIWGHYVSAVDLLLISFVLVSIGVGLLWFGGHFTRLMVLPSVIALFAFPAPAVATNQIFYELRLWTASHATALLQFAGIPAFREGNVILGTNVVAQVVDTCSGLRSMEILTLAAIFYVGWFPARRWRQVVLVVLAPAIAYVFNLFRVCVIALAPTSEISKAHTVQGLSVFFGAITCLILVDRVLGHLFPAKPKANLAISHAAGATTSPRDAEPNAQAHVQSDSQPGDAERTLQGEAPSETATDLRSEPQSSGRLNAAVLVVLAFAMLGVSIWMPGWSPPEASGSPRIELPRRLDGWKLGRRIRSDSGYLWTVRYARSTYRMYQRDGKEISVFVAEDDHTNRRRSLLSRKNALPRRGFEIEERDFITLEPIEARVERVVARSKAATVLTYHWYEGTEGLASEILRALFALDQSRFRRAQPARVFRVAIALDASPVGRVEREAELRALAVALAAALGEASHE